MKKTICELETELTTEKNKVKDESAMRRKCEAELKALSLESEASELNELFDTKS